MRGIAEGVEVAAEDPTKVRNRANYARLEKLSADLLERAIKVMKSATLEDCELLKVRCALWHGSRNDPGEMATVRDWIQDNVNPDNWELVKFGEPWIEERGPQYWPFKPAIADSPNDTWPEEKYLLWHFVNENVSAENRHLVKLLNPEDIASAKEAHKPKVIA